MGVKGALGLFFHRIGQAIVSNHHHGIEVMGFGAVHFALCRCQ
jgi:hypothetical protein